MAVRGIELLHDRRQVVARRPRRQCERVRELGDRRVAPCRVEHLALALSPGTTRNYLSSIMQKLDAANRHEAIRVAEEKGWL